MNEREELGLWGYLAIFLVIIVSLAANYKDIRNPYAGPRPPDLRHPWEDQPETYKAAEAVAEAPSTEYTSPSE